MTQLDNNHEIDPRLNERLGTLRSFPPRDPQAAARGRAQFLTQAKEIGQAVSPAVNGRPIGWFESIRNLFSKKEFKPMLTALASIMTILVLIFGGSAATVYAAQDDLPGDALYAVKTFTEDVRLALANDQQDVALYEQFVKTRVRETLQLSENGRFDDVLAAMKRYEIHINQLNETLTRLAAKDPAQADVLADEAQTMLQAQMGTLTQLQLRVEEPARSDIESALVRSRVHSGVLFAGIVESIDSEVWTISSRTVAITPYTQFKGEAVVGSLVQVNAYISENTLTARLIEMVSADAQLNITGLVEIIGDPVWLISGQSVFVTETTIIRNEIEVGDWVNVQVLIAADGTLTALAIHLPGYENAPGYETPGNETGGNEAPGNETPGNEAPGNEVPGNETPGNEAPGNEAPGNETPGNETPGNETPGNEVPGDETPGDETPGDETPGDETPGDQTPGDETPGDPAPGDETPGDQTPGGENPGNGNGGSEASGK